MLRQFHPMVTFGEHWFEINTFCSLKSIAFILISLTEEFLDLGVLRATQSLDYLYQILVYGVFRFCIILLVYRPLRGTTQGPLLIDLVYKRTLSSPWRHVIETGLVVGDQYSSLPTRCVDPHVLQQYHRRAQWRWHRRNLRWKNWSVLLIDESRFHLRSDDHVWAEMEHCLWERPSLPHVRETSCRAGRFGRMSPYRVAKHTRCIVGKFHFIYASVMCRML